MSFIPAYHNDGSGRDTYINHAGASWTNPLPGGLFYKSNADWFGDNDATGDDDGTGTAGGLRSGAGTFTDSSTHPGKTLYGKSRYGTTVMQSGGRADGAADGAAAGADGQDPADGTARSRGLALPPGAGGPDGEFDPEATALARVPVDVPNAAQRMRQPGNSLNPLDATGASTFNGVPGEPWEAPRQVDNTLLRLQPTWESTCHYGKRTGRFYTDDQAPPHENTLPEKGVNWGKSRYYP